jgi:hypothetical protein
MQRREFITLVGGGSMAVRGESAAATLSCHWLHQQPRV